MSYDKLEDAFARQYEYDLTAAKSRIAELEAECDEFRADAERYRWLRDAAVTEDGAALDRLDGINSAPKTYAEFDAAIDQAMLIEK